jgi:hypothetical protein
LIFSGVRVETISKEKSAGRPGKKGKGRAFGSGEAQAMQAGAPNAIKAAVPMAEAAVKHGVKALEDMDRLMKSENGDAKCIIANMPGRRQVQVVNALAHIYSTSGDYNRNGKALTLICCTMGIGWEMLDRWRERHWSTGSIRFTDPEKDYIKAKAAEVAEQVAKDAAGKNISEVIR